MRKLLALLSLLLIGWGPGMAEAAHSFVREGSVPWHWARTQDTFDIDVQSHVEDLLRPAVVEAARLWSLSPRLHVTVTDGPTRGWDTSVCFPASDGSHRGQIVLCSENRGDTGVLGSTSITISGPTTGEAHVDYVLMKINSYYFQGLAAQEVRRPGWTRSERRLTPTGMIEERTHFVGEPTGETADVLQTFPGLNTICHEIGHGTPLDHNPSTTSCLYAFWSSPTFPAEEPNAHDYEQLETVYAHVDNPEDCFPQPWLSSICRPPSPNEPPPPPPPAVDTEPPVVSITSPANGVVVPRRGTITIQANATDNVGVTRVEFRVDGSLLCVDSSPPYSCSWRVPAAPNKTHVISVTARDAAGNAATKSVTVQSSGK